MGRSVCRSVVCRSLQEQGREIVRVHPWVDSGNGPLALLVTGNGKVHDIVREI